MTTSDPPAPVPAPATIAAHQAPWSGRAERMVDSQLFVQLRKITASADEADRLDQLIDSVKPPVPPACAGLDPLIASAFRHPPLHHGSRFGTVREPSLWYGALDRTALWAEAAYYAFLFIAESGAVVIDHGLLLPRTSYAVTPSSPAHISLDSDRGSYDQARLMDPADFAWTQRLGTALRAAGTTSWSTRSARDPAGGRNLVVADPTVFAQQAPSDIVNHQLYLTPRSCEIREARPRSSPVVYPLEAFTCDGVLPRPA
jgi:hypothetical protein